MRLKLKQIYKCCLQVTLLRLENRYAPKLEFLTQADFEYILSCSQTKRQKYYNYLYKTENADNTELVCDTAIFFIAKKILTLIDIFLDEKRNQAPNSGRERSLA